jgi:hypothetical protein
LAIALSKEFLLGAIGSGERIIFKIARAVNLESWRLKITLTACRRDAKEKVEYPLKNQGVAVFN